MRQSVARISRGWVVALVVALAVALAAPARAQQPASPAELPGLVDASRVVPQLAVELKYASRDNFLRRNLYGSLTQCWLRREAAQKLAAAAQALRAIRPDLHFLVYDCARPKRVQWLMWQAVRGTPSEPYVADPRRGSVHSYGCAVDLTLADAKNRPLDMGGEFDAAAPRSQPRQELALHKAGKLTAMQLSNRLLLRLVMVQGGFIPLDLEWWHYESERLELLRQRLEQVP